MCLPYILFEPEIQYVKHISEIRKQWNASAFIFLQWARLNYCLLFLVCSFLPWDKHRLLIQGVLIRCEKDRKSTASGVSQHKENLAPPWPGACCLTCIMFVSLCVRYLVLPQKKPQQLLEKLHELWQLCILICVYFWIKSNCDENYSVASWLSDWSSCPSTCLPDASNEACRLRSRTLFPYDCVGGLNPCSGIQSQ